MMEPLRLYHVGFQVIDDPDIRYGRQNADFGQGFYLSDDEAFAKRWAKQRKGTETVLNAYELDLDGLHIRRFERDSEWFDYIFRNRNGYRDSLAGIDVVIGPIASDTLYDTWGVITSGLLEPELALELLRLGPLYEQTVIKTDKAREHLRFLSSSILGGEEINRYREAVSREEREYQRKLAERLDRESG